MVTDNQPVSTGNLMVLSGKLAGIEKLFSGNSSLATLNEPMTDFDIIIVDVYKDDFRSSVIVTNDMMTAGDSIICYAGDNSYAILNVQSPTAIQCTSFANIRSVYGIRSGGQLLETSPAVVAWL